jgi:hypothetical protein
MQRMSVLARLCFVSVVSMARAQKGRAQEMSRHQSLALIPQN